MTDGLPVEKMTKKIAVAKDNGTDPVGAFRFLCGPGHLSYNDPLVHPRKKGASHLHQFFGNLSADENSTYESLRKAGDSTCMSPLNRSAYWIPALLTGKGTVHTPERLVVYYKAEPSTSAFYKRSKTRLSRLPRGLAYIFGWDARRADKKHYTGVSFKCKPKGRSDIKGSMRESLAACSRLGGEFSAGLESPNCWDGTNLTSPDNRSHMTYRKREKNTGRLYCPDGYNTALPAFTLRAIYKIDKGSDVSGYEFASDHMVPAAWREPGASFHADWFGAWNDAVLAQWHATCIEAHRNCSDGNLGNGTRMNWVVGYPHDRPIEKRFARVSNETGRCHAARTTRAYAAMIARQ